MSLIHVGTLRSRILETFVVKFRACLHASPKIFEHRKNGIIAHLKLIFAQKGHLEFSGAVFLAEIFEKVSFDP